MTNDVHLIRKYRNRRLYDVPSSRHVRLIDLLDFIVRGERLQVIQQETREDVTREVFLELFTHCERLSTEPQLDCSALTRLLKASLPNIPKSAFRESRMRSLRDGRAA